MTQPDLTVLAAVLSRQSSDLSVYAGFLVEALAGALPPENVVVERRRGLFGRAKDDAPVVSVAVRLGENTFTLRRPTPDSAPVATVSHTVGGIVLKTATVALADWTQQVAAALGALTETNADAAAALARITRFTV